LSICPLSHACQSQRGEIIPDALNFGLDLRVWKINYGTALLIEVADDAELLCRQKIWRICFKKGLSIKGTRGEPNPWP
jgi:hypothetical protein